MADTPSPDDPIFGDKPDEPIGGSPSAGGVPAPPPPPPPPSPAPPPSGPPPQGPGAGSSVISDAFSWAVEIFRSNAAVFIGLAAIVFALRAAQTFIGNIIIGGSNVSTGSPGQISAGVAALFGITAVLSIVFGVLSVLASIGVYRAALRRTQGVEPSFDQLTTGENLGKFILVSIALGLAVAIGTLLCLVPGLLALFFWLFAPYLALDKGMGIGEAFRTSSRMVLDNLGTVFVAGLIAILASMLSGLIYGVLVLIMLPFSALFTAYVYRRIQGEPIAP